MVKVLDRIKTGEVLIAEGALGTEQQKRGLEQGDCGEEWNLILPETVLEIHRSYIDVGVDLIYTNTFGGTMLRLMEHRQKGRLQEVQSLGIDPDDLETVSYQVNVQGAMLARKAVAETGCLVAGDLGPTAGDKLITGAFTPQQVMDSYRQQAIALRDGGVDLLVMETVFDPEESRLACRAIKDLGLPLLVSVAITRRNLQGVPATDFGILINQLPSLYPDAHILGVNCGQDINLTLEAVECLSHVTEKPILAKPNAGVPEVVKGKVVYSLEPSDMAQYTRKFLEAGANIIGGCCGTTPEHIVAIRESI